MFRESGNLLFPSFCLQFAVTKKKVDKAEEEEEERKEELSLKIGTILSCQD